MNPKIYYDLKIKHYDSRSDIIELLIARQIAIDYELYKMYCEVQIKLDNYIEYLI
jgi:hypothetical protein